MKYKMFVSGLLVFGMMGCTNMKDGEYLGGMIEVSGFSKSDNGEGHTKPQSEAASKSFEGCSENDASYHSRDNRWCANLYLPGAVYSDEILVEEKISVPVDLAYIRAKRHLKFKDPDDTLNSQFNERYEWDGISGTYYGVKGRYGGPLMQKLYFSDYDLQIEKINNSTSKVKIKYKVYGREFEASEFGTVLFSKIKGDGQTD